MLKRFFFSINGLKQCFSLNDKNHSGSVRFLLRLFWALSTNVESEQTHCLVGLVISRLVSPWNSCHWGAGGWVSFQLSWAAGLVLGREAMHFSLPCSPAELHTSQYQHIFNSMLSLMHAYLKLNPIVGLSFEWTHSYDDNISIFMIPGLKVLEYCAFPNHMAVSWVMKTEVKGRSSWSNIIIDMHTNKR